jgi:hypothetical protein
MEEGRQNLVHRSGIERRPPFVPFHYILDPIDEHKRAVGTGEIKDGDIVDSKTGLDERISHVLAQDTQASGMEIDAEVQEIVRAEAGDSYVAGADTFSRRIYRRPVNLQ